MDVLLSLSDPAERAFLERILRVRGHRVTLCEGAEDARRAAATGRYELAVVGRQALPGALAAEGAAGGSRPFVLAVAASDAGPDECVTLIHAGADDILERRQDDTLAHSRLAVAEEVVRHRAAAQAAARALSAHARQAEALADLGRRALEDPDVHGLFAVACASIATTLDVDLVEVLKATPDGTEVVLEAGVGWKPGLVGSARESAAGGSQAGFTLRAPEPVVVEDLRTESRFRASRRLSDHGAASGVGVPIRGPARRLGVVGAWSRTARAFPPEDVWFLGGVGNILGAAVARARAEERTAAVEERSRSVLEGALDAVVAMDQDERVTEWNAKAEQVFGWTRAEAVGRHLTDLVMREEDREPHRKGLARFLSTGEGPALHRPVLVTARRRDGTEFPAEMWITPVRANGGFHFYAFVRDVTERVAAEEALKRADAERAALEKRVHAAQKAESLAVLAGGVAHDFNNLLTSVLGNADLALLSLPSDSKALPFVERIRVAGRRAADLTAALLAYAGKSGLRLEPVEPNALVAEMTGLLQAVVSKDVRIVTRFGDGVPTVLADPTPLRQVLMNLITNASEACEGKGGDVIVETSASDVRRGEVTGSGTGEPLYPGRYARIAVTDPGVGMDAATLPRIFDPFFSTKRTGRGLGLAAVLGIVRGHCGAIRVESLPGRGSTFEVFLPAAKRNQAPAEPAATEGWRGQGTILVVDDEDEVRRTAAALLRSLGFQTVEAADGLEAASVFARNPERFTAVVLDLTMPRMDGARTLERLRAVRPDVRVLVASGYAEDEVRARFPKRAGPTGYLPKPFTIDSLRSALRALLAR